MRRWSKACVSFRAGEHQHGIDSDEALVEQDGEATEAVETAPAQPRAGPATREPATATVAARGSARVAAKPFSAYREEYAYVYGDLRRVGAVIGSIAIFGAATIMFGLSRVFWFSLLMLAVTGAADTISTILRQTIRQLATPNNLRGRMTSINMIFFMGGPQLGEVEAGTVAALIGAPLSVVTGGVACLLAAGITFFKARTLRRYEQ